MTHLPDNTPAKELHLLDASDFQPYVGEQFRILFSEQDAQEAILESVTPLGGYTPLTRGPFAITLQTDQQTKHYQQAIYTIEHPALGSFIIFLVPVGVRGKGMQYEAVFS